jgi:hypothetical protein
MNETLWVHHLKWLTQRTITMYFQTNCFGGTLFRHTFEKCRGFVTLIVIRRCIFFLSSTGVEESLMLTFYGSCFIRRTKYSRQKFDQLYNISSSPRRLSREILSVWWMDNGTSCLSVEVVQHSTHADPLRLVVTRKLSILSQTTH